MAKSFDTKDHAITLALRDESDHLVTQSNLASKVYNHETLKLVNSPTTEALNVVNSLKAVGSHTRIDSSVGHGSDESNVPPLKLALFTLQKYIKEEDFAVEFMLKGGMRMLVRLVERENNGLSGNSLAYALQGVRGILEFEHGWGDLSDTFISRLLLLIVSATQPNILRPSTAIVRKLVISSPQLGVDPSAVKSKGKKTRRGPEGEEVNVYGFERIWGRMEWVGGEVKDDAGGRGTERLLRVVCKRLEGGGDLELAAQSLGLINALLRSAYQEGSSQYLDLVTVLEDLSIRRYVSRLMPTCSNNLLEPQILSFQARYATVLHRLRMTHVRPKQNPADEKMLAEIWAAGKLGEPAARVPNERNREGWKRMGLESGKEEEPPFMMEVDLFKDVGVLGLQCLHWFAVHEDSFRNNILEQQAKPLERRCPIGKGSAECVKILCDYYQVSQANQLSPPSFQLFLLNFPRLHSLVLRFFIRMWQESESRLVDFDKVSLLVRSQIRLSLTDEATKTWLNLETDFLETGYRTIRDRQMALLEREDGMFEKSAIRELRAMLNKEAYEVLAEQRIGCMLQGSWFNSAKVILPGVHCIMKPNSAKPLRFLRLSPNRRTIAWDDFAQREPPNPTFDSLRERIDISNISSVRLGTGCAIGSRSPNLISKRSFSIMCGEEMSLLDLDAIHAAQLAEWTDGIRVLRGEGGMKSQDSADYVHILAELALKVRLLDITGDGVEIPEQVEFGPAPRSVDFWFAK
ncbi:hypothetical protein P7C73_g1754, partial [Tremellales sp. Uapishka_1]